MALFQIFEDITESTLTAFSRFINELPDNADITLEVMSYGGDVFSGIAIFQKLRESLGRGLHYTAKVYGLAASSAADIVLACNRVEMASTSSIMIHSAWDITGEVDRGIELANQAQLAVIHKRLPDYSEKDLQKDRWFTASEALKIGLIDYVFDVDLNSKAAKLAAKYLAKHSGGFKMDEIKKEEVIEEKAEEIEEVKEEDIKEEKPSLEDVVERISEKLSEIDERLRKIEEGGAMAECGGDDRRDNGRLKAVYDRINAICAPATPKVPAKKAADPKEELERYKAKYPNLDSLTDVY